MDYSHIDVVRICREVIIRYSVVFISLLLLLLSASPSSLSQPPPSDYSSLCSSKPYKCGELPELYYPFWGGDRPVFCGGGDQFKLTCEPPPPYGANGAYSNYTFIQMGSQKFEVIHVDPSAYTMEMKPMLDSPDVCSPDLNFALSPYFFRYNQSVHDITVISDCPTGVVSPSDGKNFTCAGNRVVLYYVGGKDEVLKRNRSLRGCGLIMEMPTEAVEGYDTDAVDALKEYWGTGFNVSYSVREECIRCLRSNPICRSNYTDDEFSCYCHDGSRALGCFGHVPLPPPPLPLPPLPPLPPPPHKDHAWNWKVKLAIVVTGAAIAVLSTICCFICKLEGSWWRPTKSTQDIEAFLDSHTLKRYKFSDVKKMTNSFKVKLGQGGFGAVYKGKLFNGSNVAVKMLTRSKGNGEEFINEVASISRTSHVNVVALLGFCIQGRKKALIYEFMPNGSLDKFIYNKGQENILSLSWDNLYQIAIGIAKGLEYLHRGCNTRILHFDIKPHNILLDENFCPKISDFGLAKLCPRKESIVSMSDARGTIGYIAPEVWNRQFGGVSHKSDVYSFGMMLLEIVGGRKNINAEASHTSEIYFPDWIYRKLEEGTGSGLDEEVAKEENGIIKKMTMVGLWCIQTFPNDRPTMGRVIEMLEGNMNSLEMPPKPVLSSPVRSVVESSTTFD